MICDECETVAHCMKNGCVPKTTKQTEAMKLALEALEGLEALLLSMGLTHLIVYGDTEKAITNLQKELEDQPAQQEPVAIEHCLWARNGNTPCPHTSPPAQRTWIGLSDLDIDELENEYMKSAQTAHQFLRAIEAKLRSKNT